MSSKRPPSNADNRTYNIAVVGLSGTEKEKGVCGIGKSCLINRFIRPAANDYYTDHISVLSQSDFAGRVVNNDHFLYWGETSRADEGCDWKFRVIEQTEFVDDSSFQSFRIGKPDPYFKRCSSIRLQSAEKLAYICKNQLGLEHEFHQELLPDGRISIDGFLCLFDVSQICQRPIEHQVQYTALILSNLIKTKKPIVFVTTKNDEAYRPYISEAERLVNRKELKDKGQPLPIVETSAHHNVNVELAFLTLAHAIERTGAKAKPARIPTYAEASRAREERLDVAREAYSSLIRASVLDYRTPLDSVQRRLRDHQDYIHFIELAGSDSARKLFNAHITRLKEDYLSKRQSYHLRRLEIVLRDLLPDLHTINDRSWYSMLQWLRQHKCYEHYFLPSSADGIPWTHAELMRDDSLLTQDDRIPFDLISECSEAEAIFRNHVNSLRVEYRKTELKQQFKQLLEDNHHVHPGKSLSEVAIFFIGRECFTSLSEKDKQEIYDAHQMAIKDRACRNFLELLLEYSEDLCRFERDQVTSEDIRIINECLQNDIRYQSLARMDADRMAVLLKHLGFIQRPYRDTCPFRESCADCLISHVLSAKARRPQSWHRGSQFLFEAQDNRLHFIILGTGGLADQLAQEIRLLCTEEEYTLDGELYTLDYRTIDGDVSLPKNSFKTDHFVPHGCFCVFNSLSSLEYVRQSLEKTLLSDLQRDDRLPFQGLPIVLVLGHNPDVNDNGLIRLRSEGQILADRLQCPFVDVPSSMMVGSSHRFHVDQIGLAMHNLVKSIKHRSYFITTPWHASESIEPDLRVLLCICCGDDYTADLPLSPLLNHQLCYVTTEEDYMTITLETYLNDSKRKVEVTVSSYHGASHMRGDLFHGYILIYCTKRRASLSILRAFARRIGRIPTKILAITETGANAFFSNEYTQNLLTEGNSFADSIGASFTTTCANFQQQTASYTPFFRECWEQKEVVERGFQFCHDDSNHTIRGGMARVGMGRDGIPDLQLHERMKARPPAALPHHVNSSSNSEDSDGALADGSRAEGTFGGSDSDSRGCTRSTSPRLCGEGGGEGGMGGGLEEDGSIYSEIGQDTDCLIKPPAKYKRTDSSTAEFVGDGPAKKFPIRSAFRPPIKTKKPSGIKKSSHIDPRYVDRQPGSRLANTLTPSSNHIVGGVNLVKAPLAMPEQIEFGDYAQVKISPPFHRPETISGTSPHSTILYEKPTRPPTLNDHMNLDAVLCDIDSSMPGESCYASVNDALPSGVRHRIRSNFHHSTGNSGRRTTDQNEDNKSDSDSVPSTGDEEERCRDPWVNRRVVAVHKKKNKSRRGERRASASPADRVAGLDEDIHALLGADQLDRERKSSYSDSNRSGDETPDDLSSSFSASLALGTSVSPASLGGGVTQQKNKKRSVRNKKKSQSVDRGDSRGFTWREGSNGVAGQAFNVSIDEKDGNAFFLRKLRLRSDTTGGGGERQAERKAREEERRRAKAEKSRNKAAAAASRKNKQKGSPLILSCASMGVTLTDVMNTEGASSNTVPMFICKCIEQIEREGLTVEGLYRVPGARIQVDSIIEQFRDDCHIDLSRLEVPVNAVVTALKQFFSDLSEPVVPKHLYEDIKEACNMPDRTPRLLALRGVLRKLPPVNLEVLKFIICHLDRVAQHSSENSMDSKNLAICWWPTLMRPDITSLDTMYLTSRPLEEFIQLLIDQVGFFFRGESEVN